MGTESKVVGLDTEAHQVETAGGETYKYDYLVLASGSRPRTLSNVKGATSVDNVFVLRSPSDGNGIAEKAEGKNVVIVGSSFIGMEVAAFLSTKSGAASVTVVGNSPLPFGTILGDKVGEWIMKLHQAKGKVQFVMGTNPVEFVAGEDDTSLSKIVMADGRELPADLCVLGVGVEPNTDYLAATPIEKDPRGFVQVNEYLQSVSVPDVYAVGDIAKFPLRLPCIEQAAGADYSTAIGHWQIALSHGKTAGLNVAAKQATPVGTVPFFWSMQYGKSLRYAGHVPSGDTDIIIDGDLDTVDGANFVAYYFVSGQDTVAAVATLMRDPVAADFANLTGEGKSLKRSDIADEKWRNKYSLEAKC